MVWKYLLTALRTKPKAKIAQNVPIDSSTLLDPSRAIFRACSTELAQVDERIGSDKALIQMLLRRIDSFWLSELEAKCSGEFFSVLAEAAAEVESGSESAEQVVAKALEHLIQVRELVQESLAIRSAAREGVAFDGGMEQMRSSLEAHCSSVASFVAQQLELLKHDEAKAREVKSLALKAISNMREEHEAIEVMRMANMDVLLELDSSCNELRLSAWASITECIEAAKKGTALRQLVTAWRWALDRLSGLGLTAEEDAARVASLGGVEDLLHVMELHPSDATLQRDCVVTLSRMLHLADGALRPRIVASDGVSQVLKAMASHPADATLQAAGGEALQSLGLRRVLQPLLPLPGKSGQKTRSESKGSIPEKLSMPDVDDDEETACDGSSPGCDSSDTWWYDIEEEQVDGQGRFDDRESVFQSALSSFVC